jgi:FMN-dependent NADH-azoreductase
MRVLVLQTSLRGDDSASRKLVDSYLSALRARGETVDVTVRDLAAEPIPHLPAELVPVQLGLAKGEGASAALAEQLITELESADVIVIGLAMYNFTVPSTLKAWLDHIMRVRRTFVYQAGGPVGLLPAGKKVVALLASGGVYSEGPAQAMDLATPYLHVAFGFVGIKDIEIIRAEAQAAPEIGAVSLDKAVEAAARLA